MKKRILCLALACSFLLSACGQSSVKEKKPSEPTGTVAEDAAASQEKIEATPTPGEATADTPKGEADSSETVEITPNEYKEIIPEYEELDDPTLLRYVEDRVYADLISELSDSGYLVENVDAIFISKEYIDELSYNSKTNIFFGYSLEELDEQFQGTRYVFTLGTDGTTVVEPYESYDDSYEKMVRNVAVGAGVILVCVTVSAVTAGTGVPAVSMIFAASAKTGAIMAVSSGAFGGVASGIVTGIQTGDTNAAVKAGLLAASEGFKWGAISGALVGGATQGLSLYGATINGLTMNEAATIQMESGYPLDVIKQFSSMEQYNICKDAGLTSKMVNGKTALIRNIDLNYVDDLGRTNLERMQQGLAALDPSGEAYELHHIGQNVDSTLAILTKAEHMQGGNNKIWHIVEEATKVHGPGNTWNLQRAQFWKDLAMMVGGV